ncbi:MAG: hypothetical protein NTU83_05340, partial [Candidatus Hydrogenedentes bacterium]|nr:hypothetical protein [Candidatus Hydrogenedentota bacterium]
MAMYAYFLIPPYYPKLLGTYDYRRYFGPQAYFMDHAIHSGEFPLWNPLALCGMPFAASPQQTAFYPPHLLRSLLTFHPTPFKTHVGLALLMVLHMLLAGAGTYALAREYRLSRSAGLVAAFAFMFGPHFVRRVLEQWVLAAVAAWFPLLLLLVRRAMRTPGVRGKLYYASAAALVFGLSTLAGFPQLTFYTAIGMGLFCILERVFDWAGVWAAKRGQDAPRANRRAIAVLLSDGAVLGIVCVLAAAVAMAMLLPASEFVRASARIKTSGLEVNAAPQDLSPLHLFKCMVAYQGATYSEQGCRAAGLGVLFLAFMAVAHRRRRDVAVYGVLFLILTDCTLGPPFPFGCVVYAFDIFQFSSPWRAGILAGLPLAMLAGFGVDAAVRNLQTRKWAVLRSLLILVLGGLALYVLVYWYYYDLPAQQQKNAYPHLMPAILFAPALTLTAIILAGWLPFPRFGRAALPVLVFAEMFLWNMSYIPWFSTRSLYRDTPEAVAGAPRLCQENARWADPGPNTFFYTLKPAMNGYDPVCLNTVRRLLCANGREKNYVRSVKYWEVTSENQWGNLFLKRPFWLARQYAKGPLPSKEDLFPPSTTVFLDETPSLPVPEVPASAVPSHGVSENTERVSVADARRLAERTSATTSGAASVRCTLPTFQTHKRHAVLCIAYAAASGADLSMKFRDAATGRKAPAMSRTVPGKHYRVAPGRTGVLEYPLPDFDEIQATLAWKAPRGNRPFQLQEAYVLHDLNDENGLIAITARRVNSVDLTLNDLPGNRILVFNDAMFPG